MTLTLAYAIFPACLACIVGGSIWLDRGLDRLGDTFAMLPGILGLLTALGADSPEISSAVSALFAGRHEVSVGVVIGSNLFNLAGLMGLGAIIAGRLRLRRSVTAFNGAISLLATGIIVLLVLHRFSAPLAISLLGAMTVLYAIALSVRAARIRPLPLPGRTADWIAEFLSAVHVHANRKGGGQDQQSGHTTSGAVLALMIGGALLLIVMGSVGILHATLRIGGAWGISDGLIGALILATLTGLPNVYTSARLALRGKGAAVVSETLNSNTINMVIGIGVPAMIFGASANPVGIMELWWLLALTAVALSTGHRGKGADAPGGLRDRRPVSLGSSVCASCCSNGSPAWRGTSAPAPFAIGAAGRKCWRPNPGRRGRHP